MRNRKVHYDTSYIFNNNDIQDVNTRVKFNFYTQSYNSDIDEIGRINSNNDRMIIKCVTEIFRLLTTCQQHIQLQISFPLECPRQAVDYDLLHLMLYYTPAEVLLLS